MEHVQVLTAGGRKLLLNYDGYMFHMNLRIITLLRKHNIIVYALPAPTSSKTQPLDVSLFGKFKDKLNDTISECIKIDSIYKFDVYDFCHMMRHACNTTFTRKNIMTTFLNKRAYGPCVLHRSCQFICTIQEVIWKRYLPLITSKICIKPKR